MVAALMFTVVGYALTRIWQDRTAETERADQATVVAEDLCRQVQSLGWACVHDPSELQGAAGPPGPAGENGRGVASTECVNGVWLVRYTDGVTDYSAGPCVGSRGATGASGKPGADGVDGEDGESVTGPPGPAGATGETGAPGRGVTDTECRETPDGWRWWVAYSDGSEDADAGPCYSPGLLD